ncbi:hypothetical protein [Wenzhouxiangella sediminis]|uniref:Right-handed parallel beta-helix repeat-containing protein n=1 Tax=Wenzhouxiangella sediminis TaxID=1792836 RepID=A0A3E1KB89_9GAMM|nr:hypothetical protein [Wenzhouxiangella sediminis]RFF31740.1 hypothetical protein DZC52_03585 [Wenzhouxiangella sediminis]
MIRYAFFLLCIALTQPLSAAVALITVGGTGDCDFSSIQDAVDAVPLNVPEGDLYVIRVARSGTYNGVSVEAFEKAFLMEGGYAECSSALPDTNNNTVIDGGGANTQVIDVRNTIERKRVTLANLTIQNASGLTASGLYVSGTDVNLRNVTIQNVTGAIRGAGVRVEGDSLGATLILGENVAVIDNAVSQEGGGIYCGDGARLEIYSATGISNNTASQGGGIYANGCSGFINSGATGLAGLFYNVGYNTATFGGGGIYLDSTQGPTDIVIGEGLTGLDPRPLIIENEASVQGGGIMAVGADTRLTVRNALVGFNVSGSLGGGIQVRNGAEVIVEGTRPRCAGAQACSAIEANEAPLGGAFSVGTATLSVERTRVLDNIATSQGSVLFLQSQDATARFENALVVGNDGASVFYQSDPSSSPPLDTSLEVLASTIVDNPNATRVFELNSLGEAFIGRSIVQAPGGVPVADFDASNEPTVECGFIHEAASVNEDVATAVSTTPGFIDPGAGDYRLDIADLAGAVDRCPANPIYAPLDLLGEERPYDTPLPDVAGPFDPGAFEGNDRLFRDAFDAH